MKKFSLTLLILVTIAVTSSYSQNDDYTYTVEHSIRSRTAKTKADLDALPPDQKPASYTFYDGFGRIIQEVKTNSAGNGKDIIQPHEYDELGREPREFLPFTYSNTTAGTIVPNAVRTSGSYMGSPQQLYYSGTTQNIAADIDPFVINQFHLDRPDLKIKSLGVGNDWHTGNVSTIGDGVNWKLDRGKKQFARTNNSSVHEADKVLHWAWTDADGDAAAYASVANATDYYSPNELTVNESWDEHGRHVAVFTDARGFKVAKQVQKSRSVDFRTYLTTYYVYDNVGQLRFTLSPKFVKNRDLTDNTISIGEEDVDGLCTYFEYDDFGRLIFEQKPGRVTTEYVYDAQNRPILTQTSGQAKRSVWSYVKYDALGRLAYSGQVNFGGSTRSDLQNGINDFYGVAPQSDPAAQEIQTEYNQSFVTRQPNGEIFGYSLDAYPYISPDNMGYNVDHVYYYDDYDFKVGNNGDLNVPEYLKESNFSTQLFEAPSHQASAEGLQTGKRTKILYEDGRLGWICSVIYYDKYSRVIQTWEDNFMDDEAQATDMHTSQLYNELGQVVSSVFQCEKKDASIAPSLPSTILSVTGSTYDNLGRLMQITQGVNNGQAQPTQEILIDYSYNDLGQVIQKGLGNTLQKVDYKYNIRGWLTAINNSKTLGTPGNQPDVFGLEINYQTLSDPFAYSGSDGNYDGRITAVRWMSISDHVERAYRYEYDERGQLADATFKERQNGSTMWDNTNHDYSMAAIGYDENGNIRGYKQGGLISRGIGGNPDIYGAIDNLHYTIPLTSNQVDRIDDVVSTKTISKDFNDNGSISNKEYTYDDDGNLVHDANKNITIEYNTLGLPNHISFINPTLTLGGTSDLDQIWTADGIKLHSLTNRSGTHDCYTSTDTYYSGQLFLQTNTGGKKEGPPDYMYMQTPAGRCIYNPLTSEWHNEYHIKDHQGNLRAAVQETFVYEEGQATMELVNQQEEQQEFEQVNETRHLDVNNARTGVYASLLNPLQGKIFGPMKMVKLSKGDTLQLEAFAHYLEGPRTKVKPGKIGKIVDMLLGGAATANYIRKPDGRGAGVAAGATLLNLLVRTLPQIIQNRRSSGVPEAGLQYVIYDKDTNYVSFGEVSMTSLAETDWEPLQDKIVAEQDGLVQFYVINESEQNVLFDDVGYWVRKPQLIQENHYNPFGLSLEGIEREGQPDHAFQYSGKEQMEEYGLDLMDFGARAYDPQIGRWWAMDPMADKYPSWSPYNYCFNDPINSIDPDGRDPSPGYDPAAYAAAAYQAYGATITAAQISGVATFMQSQYGMYSGLGGLPGWYQSAAGTGYQYYAMGPAPWQPVGQYMGSYVFEVDQALGIATSYNSAGQVSTSPLYRDVIVTPGSNLSAADMVGYTGDVASGSELGVGLGTGLYKEWYVSSYIPSTTINTRINASSFSKMASTYSDATKLGHGIGVVGMVIDGTDLVYSGYRVSLPESSPDYLAPGRFAYKAAGVGASTAAGIYFGGAFGGPAGAVAGGAIGLGFSGAEWFYDSMFIPYMNAVNDLNTQWEAGLKQMRP